MVRYNKPIDVDKIETLANAVQNDESTNWINYAESLTCSIQNRTRTSL